MHCVATIAGGEYKSRPPGGQARHLQLDPQRLSGGASFVGSELLPSGFMWYRTRLAAIDFLGLVHLHAA
jgi:hypothetical protein